MPTNTDLVTDLPADFEVFGQAVDTTLADLKGGTTGQILSKATNTDMDFVWIANDQGDITAVNAGTGISGGGTSGAVTITNSMATAIDAKGDLIVGTGADTFDRLASGTTGQILAVDTTTATGLKWITNDIGDITAVTATSPLTGGGTSGDVTIGIQASSTTQSGAVQLTDSTSSTSTTTAATPNAVKSSYDLANAAIPKSTVTAKGSIVTATAASTPANLSVGSDYGFLQALASASTGLQWNSSAWTTYTPTVGVASGSLTSATIIGRYIRIGRLCIVQNRLSITTNGTAGTGTYWSIPFTSQNSATTMNMGVGRENSVTGSAATLRIPNGDTNAYMCKYDGTYLGGNGYTIDTTICYEVA